MGQEDEIERVTESGLGASCCTVVLILISIIMLVVTFPLSLLCVIKVGVTCRHCVISCIKSSVNCSY